MLESEYSVAISLIVNGCDLKIVDNLINVKATQFYSVGDYISNCLPPVSENLWIFTKKFCERRFMDYMVRDVIKTCNLDSEKIKFINDIGSCCLRISIQSDYAQIGIDISNQSIQSLSSLGIDVEMSIFSWGGMLDNE